MSSSQGVTTSSAELEVSGREEYSFTFSEGSLATAGQSFFVEPSPREGEATPDGVKIALKFLLSNVAAGIVIGKAGTNITLLQEASGARIQLSRNNVFYPGTAERVLLLTGSVRSVLLALYLILVKLTGRTKWQNAKTENGPDEVTEVDVESETTQVKIVMPAAVCGAIIGRGGETVRGFAEDSGASISVSPQERSTRPDRMGPATDRIVTVTGGVQQILRAVALVVTTVAEDPNYVRNVGLSVNYAPRPSVGTPNALMSPQAAMTRAPFTAQANTPTPSSGSFTQSSYPQDPSAMFAQPPHGVLQRTSPQPSRVESKLSVPDEHVGAIIGKGGEILAQLQDLVGVKVTISGRGEFEPGTRNRVVSITGPPDAVNIGQMLITQKVHERIEQLQRQGSI